MSDAALRRWGPLVGIAMLAFGAGWAARVPDAPIPRVVLRTVGGVRTVEIPAEPDRDPPTAPCVEEARVAVALLDLPEEVAPAAPATESACRARVALATAITTGRQLEQLGEPAPFPEDLPEEFREAAFTRVAREVEATCPGFDLQRVDCSELPCMALFVTGPGASGEVTRCPAWTEAYGSGGSSSNGSLIGADGQDLSYSLVGPVIPRRFLPPPEPEPDYEPLASDNGTKRLMSRAGRVKDEVMAALGARELTEAEIRDQVRQPWIDQAAAGDEGAAKMLEWIEAEWAAEDAR